MYEPELCRGVAASTLITTTHDQDEYKQMFSSARCLYACDFRVRLIYLMAGRLVRVMRAVKSKDPRAERFSSSN